MLAEGAAIVVRGAGPFAEVVFAAAGEPARAMLKPRFSGLACCGAVTAWSAWGAAEDWGADWGADWASAGSGSNMTAIAKTDRDISIPPEIEHSAARLDIGRCIAAAE